MATDSPFPSPYPEEPKPTAQTVPGADNSPGNIRPESVWMEEITEDNFPPDRPVRSAPIKSAQPEHPVSHESHVLTDQKMPQQTEPIFQEPVVEFQKPPFTEQTPIPAQTPEDLFEDEEPESKNTMRIFEIGAVVLLIFISGAFFYFRNDQPQQHFDVSGVISPKTGGTVSYTDTDGRIATVIIPKNALAEDTRIEIRRVAAGSVTDMYRLLPANVKFLKPVTIAIPYKESGLKKGQKPEDIKLKYWIGEGGLPLELKYEIYPNGRRLGAQVMGF